MAAAHRDNPGSPASEARAARTHWPLADLPELLAEHCRSLEAEGGAVLRVAADGRVEILAVWPAPDGESAPPEWLRAAVVSAPQVAGGTEPVVRALPAADELYGETASRQVVLVPLRGGPAGRGVAAFVGRGTEEVSLVEAVGRVGREVPLLGLYEMHLTAGGPAVGSAGLRSALEVVAAIGEPERFLAAAMAFCNELAARWRCERVSLGFLRGRYVRLRAMSHTEKFSRKMKVVQLIEAAMEESLDQDLEVAYPADEDAEFVNRFARELSQDGHGLTVLSLPIRRGGAVVAVVTLERAAGLPFSSGEVESLRLTCDLCTARLVDLWRRDRWFGARAGEALRGGLAAVVGPRHTWLKVAALVLAVAVVASLRRGEYRIKVPFVFQATRQQVVVAPFDGQIQEVLVKVGQKVRPGQVLAKLRTVELRRELNRLRAELFEYRKRTDAARGQKKWTEAEMAEVRCRQLRERIALQQERLAKAEVKALIAGTVVKGELERYVGATVEKGQELFRVAPIESLRAELSVPADHLADLMAALRQARERGGEVRGVLAASSYVRRKIPFVVESVHPVAVEEDGRGVFKVRAALAGRLGRDFHWLRPGMEGVAHISMGRRRYAWMWTRPLVKRLRIWLWL